MPASVVLDQVTVARPGGPPILDAVSIAVEAGETVAWIGRSGAGKTTALRTINGLVELSGGRVLLDGSVLHSADRTAWRRRIGYIIQGTGLFPHRTVYDNVAVVPRLLRWAEDEILQRTESLLSDLQLDPVVYRNRFPHELSGGEQQRVGIARALVFDPDILLCDEPFAALDPIVRREQQEMFIRMRKERGMTTIFVTHDLAEALLVAGRLVHFEGGRIIEDLPSDRFGESEHPMVQRFIRSASLSGRLV